MKRKIFTRTIAIFLSVVTLFSIFSAVGISTAVFAATVEAESVGDAASTSEGQWVNAYIQKGSYYNWILNDGTKDAEVSSNVDYKLNGKRMYCLQPDKKGPVSSTGNCYIRFLDVGNKYLKRAMYHFYKTGKITSKMNDLLKTYKHKQIWDNQYLLFHYTLSNIYNGFKTESGDWSTGTTNPDQRTMCYSLAAYIRDELTDAPSDYRCYYVETKDNKQTLIYVPPNSVTITKVDKDTGAPLSGAKFELYSKASTYGSVKYHFDFKTSSKGTVTIDNLPPGEYYIKEITAPTGYELADTTVSFSISATSTSSTHLADVKFKNKKKGIKLELTKQSSNSSLSYSLSGARYNIYTDANCTKYYGWMVTDAKGYAYFGDSSSPAYGNGNVVYLPKKDYWVQEATAPSRYQLNSKKYKLVDSGNTDSNGYKIYIPDNTVNGTKGVVTDTPLIKLQILKSSSNCELTDDNSMYSLAGAEYTIYTDKYCKGTPVGTITTDEDGYGAFGSSDTDTNSRKADKNTAAYKKNSGTSVPLPEGLTYYCKETKAPTGFELDEDTVYEFKFNNSYSYTNTRIYRAIVTEDPVDDPIGIVLQKKNAVTGETVNQGLEGAVFEIQYYAQEIDKDYDVASGDTASTLSASNHKRTWYIQTNEDGFAELSSAYLASNLTSDEFYYNNGLITLPIGTVVIREVEAPQGYTVSDTAFYRRITEEGAAYAKDTNVPIEVPIDELPAVGYVGLHKLNNTRKGVANAVYGLYEAETADSTPLATLTTDKDGYGVFEYEAPIDTTLYIKEITAPTGYELDETVYPVTATTENLTVDTAVIQEVYEDSVKGNLEIKKSSDDGVVKNLWFAVVDDMGNEYNAVATDEKGKATVVGLPVYNDSGEKIEYTVKELGFKVDTTNGYYQYNGYMWEIEEYKRVIYKGVAYEGVAEDVYASLDDIPEYSRYYYGDSELAVKNQNGIAKTLEDNATVTYSFENKVKTAELEVYKKSFDGQLEDFCFEILDNYGKSHGIITTDENGYAKATGLKASLTVPNSSVFIPLQYKVKELGYKNPGTSSYYLPDKYKGAVETEYLSCDPANGKFTLTFDVYNEAETGELRIEKSSDDGDIADLWFEISAWEDWGDLYKTPLGYDKDGNEVYSIKVKTDKDGKASTNDVQLYDVYGKKLDGVLVYSIYETDLEISYKIKELGYSNGDGTYSLPDRYQAAVESEFLYLNENRIATYTCNNALVKGKLQVEKTSEDGIVSDFWFNIKSEYIDTDVCTNESGISDIIGDLDIYKKSVGNANELVEYTVTELGFKSYDDNGEWTGTYSLPDRYLAPQPQTLTLDTDEAVITVKFKNTVKKARVVLEKTDAAGNGIAGVEFNLYTADDELIELIQLDDGYYEYSYDNTASDDRTSSLITSEDGDTCDIYIDNLPYGDYYFVEVSAPNGYLPYSEKIPFSVTENNDVISLTCQNQRELFDTGSFGVLPIYICGAIALAVAFKLYYKNKRTKEVKQ